MIQISTAISLLTTLLFASGTTASPPPAPSSSPCPPAINGLISGIEINILAQWGEKNASIALQEIESKTPVNQTEFAAGKAVLVNDIMFGMQIRAYNQLIAPEGNAAIPGLAKYAAAEETELGLAKSLTGDPSHDLPILATLVSDVTTGIQLNKNNTISAASGCYSPLLKYLPDVVEDNVTYG